MDVNGDPDRLCLIADRAVDGLPDPPDGIGGELVAATPVELLARPDQPECSFLDEVEERDPVTLVVLGNRDDQAKVRVDQPLLRLRVASFDPLRQLHFLCPCEQPVATDFVQVARERVGGSCAGLPRACTRCSAARADRQLHFAPGKPALIQSSDFIVAGGFTQSAAKRWMSSSTTIFLPAS